MLKTLTVVQKSFICLSVAPAAYFCQKTTESGPYLTVNLFFYPKPNRDGHGFKMNHWVCVTHRLLPLLQPLFSFFQPVLFVRLGMKYGGTGRLLLPNQSFVALSSSNGQVKIPVFFICRGLPSLENVVSAVAWLSGCNTNQLKTHWTPDAAKRPKRCIYIITVQYHNWKKSMSKACGGFNQVGNGPRLFQGRVLIRLFINLNNPSFWMK